MSGLFPERDTGDRPPIDLRPEWNAEGIRQGTRTAHPETGDIFALWPLGILRCLACGTLLDAPPGPCPRCGRLDPQEDA